MVRVDRHSEADRHDSCFSHVTVEHSVVEKLEIEKAMSASSRDCL